MKQRNYTAEILILASIALGLLLAYYTAPAFTHWFLKMDMVPEMWVVRDLARSLACVALCLFIGGYILGLINRLR